MGKMGKSGENGEKWGKWGKMGKMGKNGIREEIWNTHMIFLTKILYFYINIMNIQLNFIFS